MKRNLNARNFGLRNADINRALVNAYRLNTSNSQETRMSSSTKSKLNKFGNYLKEHHGIKDLRKVERMHVEAYAQYLGYLYETGQFTTPRSPQEYISKVNQAMFLARRDNQCTVHAVTDAALPKKSGLTEVDHSTPKHLFDTAKTLISERLSAQLELQWTIGLRFEESCKIDARAVLQEAEQTGKMTIQDGTKGGRPREVPITSNSQINALKYAANIQQNDRSLIPSHLRYNQYQTQCYREIARTELKFHGNRHHYANDRYQQLAGIKSPVRANIAHGIEHHQYIAKTLNISIQYARSLDKKVRLQISHELGHGRVVVTNSYLG